MNPYTFTNASMALEINPFRRNKEEETKNPNETFDPSVCQNKNRAHVVCGLRFLGIFPAFHQFIKCILT